jgi:ATP-dependent DNA helicase RecQ
LRSLHIIEYDAQKDTPQIYFITNRAPAAHLSIDNEKYLQRKKQFAERVENMLRYIQTSTVCRSKFIGNYFGDDKIDDCGICDNCLAKKSSSITEKEFSSIKRQMLNILADENITVPIILQSLKNIKKKKLWIVLEHLQEENIIKINIDGAIQRIG